MTQIGNGPPMPELSTDGQERAGVRAPGGRGQFLVALTPAVIVSVSLAAMQTWLTGGSIGTGWGLFYTVLMVAGAGFVLALGPRQVPRWLPWLTLPLIVACAALLEVAESWSPFTVGVGVVAYLWLRSRPKVEPVGHDPDPAQSEQVATWSASAPPTARSATEPSVLPVTDPSRRPRHAAATKIRLVSGSMRALFAACAVFCLVLGGWTLYAVVTASQGLEQTSLRWIGGAFGVMFVLFGLFFAAPAVQNRPDRLEVDATGMRRTGPLGWSLTWQEVRAVSVRVQEREIPDDFTPTPRRLRRRRKVWLMLALTDSERQDGGLARLLGRGSPPAPFSHADLLPELPWDDRSRLADTLRSGLFTTVPDLYVD